MFICVLWTKCFFYTIITQFVWMKMIMWRSLSPMGTPAGWNPTPYVSFTKQFANWEPWPSRKFVDLPIEENWINVEQPFTPWNMVIFVALNLNKQRGPRSNPRLGDADIRCFSRCSPARPWEWPAARWGSSGRWTQIFCLASRGEAECLQKAVSLWKVSGCFLTGAKRREWMGMGGMGWLLIDIDS